MYNTFLLQAGGGAGSIIGMWPLVAMFGVMWWFFIRPQNKKQKEQQAFLADTIQKGQEVATSAGIIGKISKIDNDIVTLQIDTKTFMKVTKGSISKEMTEAIKGLSHDA